MVSPEPQIPHGRLRFDGFLEAASYFVDLERDHLGGAFSSVFRSHRPIA